MVAVGLSRLDADEVNAGRSDPQGVLLPGLRAGLEVHFEGRFGDDFTIEVGEFLGADFGLAPTKK